MYSLLNDNPLALYDGDLGNVILNNSSVQTWYDRSGNLDPNRNAIQNTPANQPLYTASDADFNGHGSLTFSGAQQIITGSFEQPNIATIYAVAKLSATATTTLTYLFSIGSGNNRMILNDHGILSANDGVSNLQMLANTTNSINTIMCATFNTTNSYTYQDNTVFGKTGTLQNYNISGALIIGTDKTNANSWTGKIACLAIYSGAHSTEQRTRIMRFLSNKYGIAIDQPLCRFNADAGGYSLSSGTSVSSLLDQSLRKDTNRNAIQNTVGNQPALTAIDSALNNQGTITFPSANSVLETTAIAIAQPSTYYVVCQHPVASAIDIFIADDYTNGSRNAIGMTSNGYSTIAAATSVSGTTNYKNAKIVYCIIFNNASSAIYNNNSLVAEVLGTAGVQTVARLILGNDFDHSNPYTGKFAHLEVHSGSHDADTRTSIMEALGAKYGIIVNKPLAVYDGDLGITLNGSNVAAWNDQSGQGDSNRNAIQNTAINQPLYIASDADFNGHGSIGFNGAKHLATLAFSSIITQPTTWYVVTKPASVASGFVYDGIGASTRNALYFSSAGAMSIHGGSDISIGSVGIDNRLLLSCTYSGATSTTYKNGVNIATGNSGSSSPTGITIGCAYSIASYFTGKTAYIAVYSGVHTTAQRTKIIKQLSAKYGIRILARPIAEYDGDKGITLNGSTVSGWADQSETNDTNKNAAQGTAINQPTYTLNDADFNGHGSLLFNTAGMALVTGTFTTPISQPCTYYFVAKMMNPTTYEIVFDGLSVANRHVFYGLLTQSSMGSGGGVVITAETDIKGMRVVGACEFNTTTSKLYINSSTALTTTGATVGTNTATGLTIGNHYTTSNNFNPGKIAYLACYSGVHDNETRKMIMAELSTKYNISTDAIPLAEYDGDKGITLNGSNVAAWNDQSGRGDTNRNATQSTALNQPAYIANDPDFNGHGSIQGGAGKVLFTGTFSAAITQPCTYYIVSKASASGSTNEFLFDSLTSAQRGAAYLTPANIMIEYSAANIYGTQNIRNTINTHCFVFNGATSTLYSNNPINGVAGNVGAGGSPTGLVLMNYYNQVSYPWLGKMAYFACYQGVHTNAQRKQIMSELSTKYNIPVSENRLTDFEFTTTKLSQSWQIKVATGSEFKFYWGDGTSTTTIGDNTLQTISHTYGSAGTYKIWFSMDDYTKLISFICSSNGLSGTLPSFAACTGLNDFLCNSNSFTGTLPSFNSCTQMRNFYCHTNTFSGIFPSFSNVFYLYDFRIDSNTFSGTLPSFNSNVNIVSFRCNANTFSGTMPSFAACTKLASFNAYTNTFQNTLPSFATCTLLTTFHIGGNSFTGTLPSFNTCTALQSIYINANAFSGTLPTFAACTALINFQCNSNQFTDSVAQTFPISCRLWKCDINQFSQTAIDMMLAAMVVNLESRAISGIMNLDGVGNALPSEAGLLNQAKIATRPWTVTSNTAILPFITSKISQSWRFNVTNLNDYSINWGDGSAITTTTGNGATQTVTHTNPDANPRVMYFRMADYTKLILFGCETNALSGTLPSFAACTNLQTLYCFTNSFSGAMPSFAACTNLQTLYCFTNSFSGAMPSFAACTLLSTIYGYANTFSGTLPSFAACTSLITMHCGTNSFTSYTQQTISTNCVTWRMDSNALPQASIDLMLSDMATNIASRPINGSMIINGGTNAIPSAAGLVNKATITARPWTCTTN